MNSAALIVRGGTLVTMDAKSRVIENGAIAVQDGLIVTIGGRADIESRHRARRTIDASGALLLPGLINGHAHAAMRLFPGFSPDHSLDHGPQKYIFPPQAQSGTED